MFYYYEWNLISPFVLQVVKTFVLPMLKSEGERLSYAAESHLSTEMDKGFVDHIKSALLASIYFRFLSLL